MDVPIDNVYHLVEHHEHLHIPLQIDTVPCETTEDDILAALMQLLPWVITICVCMYVSKHVCACDTLLCLSHVMSSSLYYF